MEIPVIDYVTNMDLGPISTNYIQTYILLKWGALILALVASFTTLIKRVKILILNKSIQFSFQKGPVVQDFLNYESDSESGSDLDDEPSRSCSYSSVSDTEEYDRRDEDFYVKGSVLDLATLFTTGKNVVKLWDNVADNGNVVVSEERNLSGRFLRVWDMRVNKWAPRVGRVNVNGSGGVVLRDDVTGGLAAGDVRKVGSPMVGLTGADVDMWWDANGAVSSVSWRED